MRNFFQEILDWSEVWAVFIPLLVLAVRKKQPSYLKPIIVYLWLALIVDLMIDIGWKFHKVAPAWLYPNNYLYNVHSILRFLCFSYFFIQLKQNYLRTFKKILPILSIIFIVINFIFFEDFVYNMSFSSRLLATEAGLLLFYCLQYYLFKLQEESSTEKRQPDFWVVTGLGIYVAFNFVFFLFYGTLLEKGYYKQLEYLWNFHNITFIILCIFIARAFYSPKK